MIEEIEKKKTQQQQQINLKVLTLKKNNKNDRVLGTCVSQRLCPLVLSV